MPWIQTSPMDLKIQLIADWQTKRFSITDLSQKYSISRKTVYKWVDRYRCESLNGLKDQSRMPHYSPNQTSDDIIKALVEEKLKNRKRGPKKIQTQLQRHYPHIKWPVPSTIGNWLKKYGLVKERRYRRRVPPYQEPFSDCQCSNAVWSADYKGQFYTKNAQVCYPLTISDNYTRYLLACQGLPGPRYKETKAVFIDVFREYGLPRAIRIDNGTPFAGKSLGGLSRLSVWWIQLGIMPERIDKGCPQQNGRHERMHRTLKEEAVMPASRNMKEQQQRFDWFRNDYNNYRPHEALGQEPPYEHYQKSTRPYIEKPVIPDYDFNYTVRMVRHNGEIKFNSSHYYVSGLLSGQPIGLKEIADGQWKLYYSFYPIGTLDLRKNKVIK
ncbi:integrase core domain-containing protein [Candidatus Omnitrophota bacterium]